MRFPARWHYLVLTLAVCLAGGVGQQSAAQAAGAESLVMPYHCSVVGGRVRLTPSRERVYQVLGTRHNKTITRCGPDSGDACWTVQAHRFVFDCDGTRVSWFRAARSAARGLPWRLSVDGPRMTVLPVAKGALRHRAGATPLPAGFAPMLSARVRIVPASTNDAGDRPQPTRRTGRAVLPPRPASSSATFRDGALVRVSTDALPARPDTTAIVRAAEGSLGPGSGAAWRAIVVPADQSARSGTWLRLRPAREEMFGLASLLGLTGLLLFALALTRRQQVLVRARGLLPAQLWRSLAISLDGVRAIYRAVAKQVAKSRVGSPPPPQAPPRRQPVATATASASAADEAANPAGSAAAPPPPPVKPPLEAVPSAEPDADAVRIVNEAARSTAEPYVVPDVSGDAEMGTWQAVEDMRATADDLLEMVHRIVDEQVQAGDFRAVLADDLDCIAARLRSAELADAVSAERLDLVHAAYSQAIVDLERVRTLARIECGRAGQVAALDQRPPASVAEACAFLGVNPRASVAVVKKVVDALRQNWHPDLASDEADRTARETRIKGINAAWDLIRRG